MGFQFDLPNFGAGVVTGVAGSIAAYRINNAIQKWRREREYRPQRRRMAGSVEGNSNYNRDLIELAQSGHLMGHRVPLSRLLIEPRFIPQAELTSMPEEDEPQPVFDFVPRVHDFPYLHGIYNIPSLSVDDLSRSDDTVLLVGLPGSGRTTALLAIAMWSLGAIEFEIPQDPVQEQLDEEEAQLSKEEQAERVRQRVATFEQGRRQFANSRQGVEEEDLVDPTETTVSRFRTIAPLYIHLCDILPQLDNFGSRIDPAEPVIRALQQEVGWLTAKSMVSDQYKLLRNGDALVLIDGYDDVPLADREMIRSWLHAFTEMYDDNFIIIAAPTEGYRLLASEETNAVTVYLRPWNDQMISDYVDKWITNWSDITGQERIPYLAAAAAETPEGELTPEAETRLIDELKQGLRLHSPHDLTLVLWQRLNQNDDLNESELVDAYLHDLFSEADSILPELMRMAVMQHDHGYIRPEMLINDIVTEEMAKLGVEDYQLSETGSTAESDAASNPDGLRSMFSDDGEENEEERDHPDDDTEQEDHDTNGRSTDDDIFSRLDDVPIASAPRSEPDTVDTKTGSNGDEPKVKDEKEIAKQERQLRRQISKQQKKLIKALVEADVLVPYRYNRYQFRYPALAQYIAASALADASDDILLDIYEKPGWQPVIPYLAQQRDIDMLVAEHLSQPLDVLHTHLLELATWLRFAGEDAPWRGNLLRYLGNLMVVPHQYTLVRERIAAALVCSRDNGVLVIFRRALEQDNPDILKVACLGLGALRDERSLVELENLAFDARTEIAIPAALAVGAIGSEDALYTMISILRNTQDKSVRRALAETLAADRKQGYLTLYDALQSDELMLRRAAVFGLSRIPTDWALIALNETLLEDDEQYVRLAVEVVFQEIYEASLRGAHAYPQPQAAAWLQEWAQENIQQGNIAHNLEGIALFEAALQQDFDPLARLLAMITIGQTATIDYLDDAYMALRDRQEAIRDTAYRTLGQFQEKLGGNLPAPHGQRSEQVQQQTA